MAAAWRRLGAFAAHLCAVLAFVGMCVYAGLESPLAASDAALIVVLVCFALAYVTAYGVWVARLADRARAWAFQQKSQPAQITLLCLVGPPTHVRFEDLPSNQVDALVQAEEAEIGVGLVLSGAGVVGFMVGVAPNTPTDTTATLGAFAFVFQIWWLACAARAMAYRTTVDLFGVSALGVVTCVLLIVDTRLDPVVFGPTYAACVLVAVGLRYAIVEATRPPHRRAPWNLVVVSAQLFAFTLVTESVGFFAASWTQLVGVALGVVFFGLGIVLGLGRAAGESFLQYPETQAEAQHIRNALVAFASVWAALRLLLVVLVVVASFIDSAVLGWFIGFACAFDVVLTWWVAFRPPSQARFALACEVSAAAFGSAALAPPFVSIGAGVVLTLFWLGLELGVFVPWARTAQLQALDTPTVSTLFGVSVFSGLAAVVLAPVPDHSIKNSNAYALVVCWVVVHCVLGSAALARELNELIERASKTKTE